VRFLDRYPVVITPKLRECRDFWTRHLRFSVAFEATWFVLLQAEGESATIAFMSPDHPSAPPGSETFSGLGLCFELQVEDAAAALAEFRRDGGSVGLELVDEPFGQRRFGFADPSGLWVDVVQQIDPAAGFWDRFLVDGGASADEIGYRSI
jgi:catechol 2,3-dioxygenase-like lactoylglutathione lyase family enzyme